MIKRKVFVIAVVISVVSCSKAPLELTPQQEQEIASITYGFETHSKNDEFAVTTFIDSTIQKQSQKALLQSVQENNTDNGCVLVMETNTGKVRAMVNLESINGKVIESKNNYAINNYMEPGSFIKTLDVMALLEDKKADTSSVYSSHNGEVSFYAKKIRDSHEGGYDDLSLGNALVYSSNTIFAQAITKAYSSDPKKFVDKFNKYQFGTNLDLPFSNSNLQIIPQPKSANWSNISLPWMSFGYGISLSPIQILTYYNGIANDGEVVKPMFLSEIKNEKGQFKRYEKTILTSKMCSQKTIVQIQHLLRKAVSKGTGFSCKSKKIAISGKTASVQINYGKPGMTKQFLSVLLVTFLVKNQSIA